MNIKKAVIFCAVVAVCAVGGVAWYIQEDSLAIAKGNSNSAPVLHKDQVAYTGNHWFDEVHVPGIVDMRTVINGIKVPPMPDVKINNATIAGVDIDNDGVRDDVNRYIAEQFGSSGKDYQIAMSNAKALQAMLVNPSSKTVGGYLVAERCQTHQMMQRLGKMERATLTTGKRGGVYGNTLAGVSSQINFDNCPNRAEIEASYKN